MSFHYKGLECKGRKSGNTWSNRQIWPWTTEWYRAKANRVLPRECTDHSKHPLPTTKEKTLHISSVQSLSCVRLFATPWITACQASLSITNSRSSLKFTSMESVMPSSHLILCRSLLLLPTIPPSISLFQWVNSSHEVAKVLEFQL